MESCLWNLFYDTISKANLYSFNYGHSVPGIEMYIKLANIIEESYPGIVKSLLVVNCE